jgi:hypothetical protein
MDFTVISSPHGESWLPGQEMSQGYPPGTGWQEWKPFLPCFMWCDMSGREEAIFTTGTNEWL